MTRDEAAREWLDHAQRDLNSARILQAADLPELTAAVYHCQQAAEKTLKAFLAFHDRPFRKTHDLSDIGDAVVALEPTLADAVREAVGLSEYAWRFRYPGAPYEPEADEVEQAARTAERLYATVTAHLPAAAVPARRSDPAEPTDEHW